jgi:hypothetical protein
MSILAWYGMISTPHAHHHNTTFNHQHQNVTNYSRRAISGVIISQTQRFWNVEDVGEHKWRRGRGRIVLSFVSVGWDVELRHSCLCVGFDLGY